MRSVVPLLCGLMQMSLLAAADSSIDSLRKTLVQYSACWESHNRNGCMDRFVAPGYTRVNRNGQAGNGDTLRATLQQSERTGRSGGWKFDTAQIHIYGDTALIVQSVSMPLGGGAGSAAPVEHHQTMIWIKEGDGWKVVREHISYQVAPAKLQ